MWSENFVVGALRQSWVGQSKVVEFGIVDESLSVMSGGFADDIVSSSELFGELLTVRTDGNHSDALVA